MRAIQGDPRAIQFLNQGPSQFLRPTSTPFSPLSPELVESLVTVFGPEVATYAENNIAPALVDQLITTFGPTLSVEGMSGWGDGETFADRPNQATVLQYDSQDNFTIEDLYFDGTGGAFQVNQSSPTNGHVCILLTNCNNVTVRYIDFEDVSQPIAILGGSNITVEYCRANGITGPHERFDVQNGNFVQTVNEPEDVYILNNKIIGGDTEDIISMFSAVTCEVAYNQVDGTGWSSDSGTGIILGDGGGSDQWIHDNTLLNPGQVGLAIAGGINGLIEDNIIYGPPGIPGSNIGAYCNNYYPAEPFGSNQFNNNRIWYRQEGGGSNSWWNPGGASTSGNVFEDTSLDPADYAVVM